MAQTEQLDMEQRDPNDLNEFVKSSLDHRPASMQSAVDLVNRDPNGLNVHVRAQFEDVFGEPDGTHSMDCVWRNTYNCYNCFKNCWYKFLTFLCGICIAIMWGCEFAGTSFNHVWCVTPFMKACSIECGTWQKFWATCCNCCVAPVCEACGYYWSKITITKISK